MTDFNPKVSIVIPVYNGSNYMRESIDSALAQTYDNLEVIVVNDGADDGGETEQIALSYGKKIKYYRKENGGVATALNLGIQKMTGDYFSWLSHDDVYLPDKIKAQIDYINDTREQDAIIYSDYDFIDARGKILQSIQFGRIEPHQMCFYLLTAQAIHGCTLLIPKKAFTMVGTFPEDLPTTQDYTLFLRLTDHFKFLHCSKVLVQGRQHDHQGSRTMFHRGEVHDYYCRELKRLSPEKMAKMFRPDELVNAWVKLARHFKLIDFPDCFERVCEDVRMNMTAHEQGEFKKLIEQETVIQDNNPRAGKLSSMQKIKNAIRKIVPDFILEPYYAYRIRSQEKEIIPENSICAPSTDYKLDFSKVYEENMFEGDESVSGAGSTMDQTMVLRRSLPKTFERLGTKSLLDIPCGDFNWMAHVDLGKIKYIGGDIVKEIAERNNEKFSNANRSFQHLDLVAGPLPKADTIFCRDCLVHLNFEQGRNAVKTIQESGATYLLTTTFTDRHENVDLTSGIWRTLNMELSPFNFPKPIELINEKCTEADRKFMDKCLGVWKISDLPNV